MSLQSDLNTVCDLLRSRLKMDVAVGKPDEPGPGVHVWPWRIVPKPENRNLPPPQKPAAAVTGFRLQCLLLITPADTLETVSKLELAGQAIQESPVLEGSAGPVRVMLDPMEAEDLAALFLAAQQPFTLCLPFVVESLPLP
jgi:hypothetical protein